MPATLAGCRLEIVTPRRSDLRAGEETAVSVDLEVADPWIERPRLGREVRDVDGRSAGGISLAFECDRATAVPALLAGTASERDSRIDVHTPAGFPDAGAGRGYEVFVKAPGGAEVRYGHLSRGSGRTGQVRPGEAIGTTGNTGRCVDGCGRSFVVVEFSSLRSVSTLDDLCAPIELELLVDGRPQATVRFPAGETRARGLNVGRVRAPRDRGSSSVAVEVRATRRRSTIAQATLELKVMV